MNRSHLALIIVGVVFLAVMTLIGISAKNNQSNVLWPEGSAITR